MDAGTRPECPPTKFWDGSEAVRYGIGWYNTKEKSWVITAEPELFDGFLVPMEWVALLS
jgi:hypothetical protein